MSQALREVISHIEHQQLEDPMLVDRIMRDTIRSILSDIKRRESYTRLLYTLKSLRKSLRQKGLLGSENPFSVTA